jgi:hypothetical protein
MHGGEMSVASNTLAKLAGIKKAVEVLLEPADRGPLRNFSPIVAEDYFRHARKLVSDLREEFPDLFGDFPRMEVEPETDMANGQQWYSRRQVEKLARNLV